MAEAHEDPSSPQDPAPFAALLSELEHALLVSQERLRTVIAAAPIVLFTIDRHGTCTMVEGRGLASLGLRSGAGVGRSIFELTASVPSIGVNVRRALAGETLTEPVELAGAAFDVWYTPERDESGRVTGVFGVASDVTDRVEAEQRLRRSEARWRALTRSSSDIVAVVEPDGTVRYVTPAAERILGYDLSRRRNAFDLVHPDDRERVLQAALESTQRDGISGPIEYRMRHTDGSWRWVESISHNLLHAPDVTGMLITTRDVTARKEAETALREREARFEALLQHSTDMTAVIAREGTVRYASPSAQRLMGYHEGGHAGRSLFRSVHRHDLPQVQARLSQVIASAGASCDVECRVLAADGVWHHLEARVTNLLDHPAIQGFVVNARDITDRRRAEDELARHAYHDGLTGLPNRSLFRDRLTMALARAGRRRSSVAVLFLDLDRFKVINDSLGHAEGDRVLVALAQRLESTLRPEDTVARFGGDEFALLCEDLSGPVEPVAIAERVTRALAEPFAVNDREVFVTVSIGIAVAASRGSTPEDLMGDAEAALHRAKERGRARFELFDAAMREGAMLRLETENALHRAIERDELRLLYQPIIDLNAGEMVGVEALLRWDHPTRGMVDPDEFVPLAEETGLIVPIGEWVLQEACRQVARWRRRGWVPAGFGISVNLSAGQVGQPRLAQALDAAVAEAGIPTDCVWMEITESTLMGDADAAIATLRALKERGISLSVDDFGTGYSSLSYLRRLPIDALKIDRSFISGLPSNPEDRAIAEAVVALAHSLGLGAVAEGVETEHQLVELRALGCERAQGFLFCRPVSGEEIDRLATTGVRW